MSTPKTIKIEGASWFYNPALEMFTELHKMNSQIDASFTLHPTFEAQFSSRYQDSIYELWLITYVSHNAAALCIASLHLQAMFNAYVEIECLYVKPQYRRMSIASELCNTSIEWAAQQKVDDVRLYVAEWNKDAIKFYKAFGFQNLQRVLQFKNERIK